MPRFVIAWLVVIGVAQSMAPPYDVIVRRGTVLDGTGRAR